MKKIQLVMADADSAYLESVAAYIRDSNEESKFTMKLFSDKTRLQNHLNSEPFIDILLVSPEMLPEPNQADLTIVLEDDRIIEYEAEHPSVFKYQPLNQLLSRILSIYYENRGKVEGLGNGGNRTRVLSVYSAAGGAGKTTLAVNLCKQMALMDQRVFYLNFELLHSTSLFFTSTEAYHSSQILYYLKANPDQLISKIESLKQHDPYNKVDYFDLPVNAEEMQDLSETDTEKLITSLIEMENYDSIIIDLDSAIEERTRASFKRSDQILWLLNNDVQSLHKTSFLLEECDSIYGEKNDVKKKTMLILNKHTGQSPEGLSHFNLPAIQHYLPYIPEWKNVQQGSQVLISSTFSDELLSIIKTTDETLRGAELD